MEETINRMSAIFFMHIPNVVSLIIRLSAKLLNKKVLLNNSIKARLKRAFILRRNCRLAYKKSLINVSAICTLLVAAPLRILSDTTHMLIPFG